MDSWEDADVEDIPTANIPVAAIPQAKDSWDDDEEEKKKAAAAEKAKATAPAAPSSDKAPSARKKMLKEREERDAAAAAAAAADPTRTKQQRQKIVEESDFRNTQAMFGDLSSVGELERFIPKSPADYATYGRMLGDRATFFSKELHYPDLVKELSKQVTAPMRSDDLRALIATLNTVLNDKIKAEKGAPSTAVKKKQEAKQAKAKAIANRANDDEPDGEGEGDDDYHEIEDKYDFM